MLIRVSCDAVIVGVMERQRALAPLFMLPLLLGGCAAPTGAPASGSIAPAQSSPAGGARTSDGGQVTVVASWGGPAAGASFDVKLDTHAVDLDAVDLAGATLRNDRGETLRARPWTAPKGGHHREGTLAFEGNGPAFLAQITWVELVLPGIGDLPERILRWEIGA